MRRFAFLLAFAAAAAVAAAPAHAQGPGRDHGFHAARAGEVEDAVHAMPAAGEAGEVAGQVEAVGGRHRHAELDPAAGGDAVQPGRASAAVLQSEQEARRTTLRGHDGAGEDAREQGVAQGQARREGAASRRRA